MPGKLRDVPANVSVSEWRAMWRPWWPYLKVVVALAAVGIAAWVVSGKTHELDTINGYLHHLRWWWLVVAVGAEASGYAAQARLQRWFLRCGALEVPQAPMFGVVLAGAAMQDTFPGGFVLYLAYLVRRLRRRGADDLLSAWVVVAYNLVTFAALAAIATIGLALAFGTGNSFDLVESIIGVLLLAVVLALVVTERQRLLPHFTRAVALSQRLFRWPHRGVPAPYVVQGWIDELAAISPTPGVWCRAAVLGLLVWVADMSCLALAFLAVGVGIPWRGLLLAYGAGQLATALPITPGGLGAVEGSITLALVTFGGGESSTVAAVLLYRFVSYWLVLPTGWLSWAAVAWSERAPRRLRVPVKSEPSRAPAEVATSPEQVRV